MFIDELNKKSGHVFSMYKYYYKDEKIDNDEIDEYRNNFWKRELEEIEKQIEKNPENKVQLEEKKKSIQESKQKAESANFSGWFKDKDTSERIVDLSTETLKNGTTYRAKYSN